MKQFLLYLEIAEIDMGGVNFKKLKAEFDDSLPSREGEFCDFISAKTEELPNSDMLKLHETLTQREIVIGEYFWIKS